MENKPPKVTLVPLQENDKNQFVLDNQESFRYGAMEEFGLRDDHFEEDGEIISRETIENCINSPDSEAYRICADGKIVGGVILKIEKETNINHLEILFIIPTEHSKGLGQAAWKKVEALHPETKIWVTGTPYFEKRNIHFYVNKCGFSITKFYNKFLPDPNEPSDAYDGEDGDGFFEFQKVMK